MRITGTLLVVLVAIGCITAKPRPQERKPFPERILGPFRSIFGRTTGPPSGPPSRGQGYKDQSGSATNKPYAASATNNHPETDEGQGFRPMYSAGYSGPGGPFAEPPGPSGGGPYGHSPSGPSHHSGGPYGGPSGPSYHQGGPSGPSYHQGGPSHGQRGPYGHGGGYRGGPGGPQAAAQHHRPRYHGRRPPRQDASSAYPGPSSFRPFGAYESPEHGRPTFGGPHGGPPHHGGGPGGPPQHGGPGGSEFGFGLSGFRDSGFGGPGYESSPTDPHGRHYPSSQGSSHGPPPGFGRPPSGPRYRPTGYNPGRPFQSSRPDHTSSSFSGSNSGGPQGFFGPDDYPEQFQGGQRDAREPHIITADDSGRPGPPQFDQVYHPGGSESFGPPGLGGADSGPPAGFGGPAFSNQLSSFPGTQPESSSGIIRSNPLRPSTRPFGASSPYFGGESEEYSPTSAGSQPQPFGFPPRAGPSTKPQNEEILYGRPMLMSASGKQPAVMKSSDDSPRVRIPLPRERKGRRIVRLKSPKDPNVPTMAASLASPTTVPYEPEAAASGHGHDDVGPGLDHYGGDRILYHVVGHQGPYSYRFGYDTGKGHNRLFRFEERNGEGYVKGKYGFYDKHGKLNVINYHAHPEHGFHAERGHGHGHH